MRKICFAAILLLPALALAEPKSASDWYNEGENQYNLGNFDKAVEAFKKGFELETVDAKKAAYLFNIAQSYRQANDCKNAHFFYKRFLAVADADPAKPVSAKTRKQVTDRIAELEQCANQAASISKKPPQNLKGDDAGDKPADDTHAEPAKKTAAAEPPAVTTGGGDVQDHGEVEKPATDLQPHKIVLRLTGGGTKVSTPGVAVPVQATFALTAGYPIPVNDKLTIEVGAAGTLSPVPFSYGPKDAQQDKTGLLSSVMANGAVTYALAPKLSARADLGLGVLFFSGIDVMDEPFAPQGTQVNGTLTMFHVRGALSAEYAVSPNFVIILPSLAYSYSPPKDGLVKSITHIAAFDFMAGISYRM